MYTAYKEEAREEEEELVVQFLKTAYSLHPPIAPQASTIAPFP